MPQTKYTYMHARARKEERESESEGENINTFLRGVSMCFSHEGQVHVVGWLNTIFDFTCISTIVVDFYSDLKIRYKNNIQWGNLKEKTKTVLFHFRLGVLFGHVSTPI